MRMLITIEFADAGKKSGSHRILTIGRGLEEVQSGDGSILPWGDSRRPFCMNYRESI
jgi:hypothetical protein